MKKIIIFKSLNIGIFLLATSLFVACDKDNFDITGDSTPRVFFNTYQQGINTFKFSITHTPIGSYGNITATFPVHSTLKPNSDVTVTCRIDNSLVDAYNSKNGTSYNSVPETLVQLINNILTIPKGTLASIDSIKIDLPSEVLSQLTDEAYILPVKITTISNAGNVAISSNLNTVYLVISTSWTNCYDSPLLADVVGTLITPRTGWSATIDVALYSGSLPQMFDGSTSTYWQIRPPVAYNLQVNLVTEYSGITGMRISSSSTSYGLTKVNIYSSSDGTTWTYQGTPTLSTSSSYQYIKFYAPITAQYIKIAPVTFRSTSRAYMAEFDVYKN